jgi:peptidoglycan-associated lipoprotein
MKKILLTIFAAAALGGCASGTKLDEAPVVDAGAGPGSAAAATAPAQTQVAPVTASTAATEAPGPASTGRIVYFDYDSAQIRPEFQTLIDANAQYLNHHRDRKLTVAGHTDERGGREYNLALGQERADAVRHSLHLLGVPDTQVETISFGEEKPAVTGRDEAAFAKNRRAEMAYR